MHLSKILSIAIALSPVYAKFPSLDLQNAKYTNWMVGISNETLVSQLTLPGTHDSMTYDLSSSPGEWTQNNVLQVQLKAGIRYLDIGIRHINNTFPVYGSKLPTGYDFPSVIQRLATFLKENPSEGIILRLRHIQPDRNTGSTRDFRQTLFWYIYRNPDTARFFTDHMLYTDMIPQMGELRRKFVILMDFENPGFTGGILFNSVQVDNEEHTTGLANLEQLDSKFKRISMHLDKANKSKENTFYITHITGVGANSLRITPLDVADGKLSVAGMNKRSYDLLFSWLWEDRRHMAGIVVMDFPGTRLVELILSFGLPTGDRFSCRSDNPAGCICFIEPGVTRPVC